MKVNVLPVVAGFAGSLILSAAASAAFTGLSANSYAASNGAGDFAVIDLFANFDESNVGGTVFNVFNANISLDGAANWYHASAPPFIVASWKPVQGLNKLDPTGVLDAFQYDSFVTINDAGNGVNGTTTNPSFVDDVNANTLGANAGWFLNPPTSAQANITGTSVFLGRFTITGIPTSPTFLVIDSLSLTYKVGGATLTDGIDGGVKFAYVPAPGALALLGLAGLAGTRRRRA